MSNWEGLRRLQMMTNVTVKRLCTLEVRVKQLLPDKNGRVHGRQDGDVHHGQQVGHDVRVDVGDVGRPQVGQGELQRAANDHPDIISR